jgi:hypothetical protein
MSFRSIKFRFAEAASVGVLLVWGVAVSVPIALLNAAHLLPLPVRPIASSSAVATSTNSHWQAVHILVADCPCSGFVANYLAARGARRELEEIIWIVGGPAAWEEKLATSGFTVLHRDAEQIAAHLGIQGGPWLRLISPAGVVAYSGGYAPQRPRGSADFCDLTVWQAVARGETIKPYPAFGCAASRWLRQTIDPLGMKYDQAKKTEE